MKKHIVWDSDAWMKNFENWKESYLEFCFHNNIEIDENNIKENDILDYAIKTNDTYLDDERENLFLFVPNGILAIADLGCWSGRVTGYKEIGKYISDCLYTDCDGGEWYIDQYGRFCGTFYHHDRTNYITYRQWKPWVTNKQKEMVEDKIYCGKCTERILKRYTSHLGKEIASVYGWKISAKQRK